MADNNDERIDRLIKELTDKNKNNSWDTRHSATRLLGEIGDKRAVEPLINVLGDRNWEVRRMATRSLGDIGDPRAVEPLIKALKDENNNVRWEATLSLGDIGDKRAAEPLLVALANDKDDRSRRWIADALSKMPLTATTCQEIKPLLLANVLTSKNEDVRNVSKSLMKKCRGLE